MKPAFNRRRILAVATVCLFLLIAVGLLFMNHECSALHCPVCQSLSMGRNFWPLLLVHGYLSLGLFLAALSGAICLITPPLPTPVQQKVKITS